MLSDVVKNDVVTNAKYNKLIKTINAIQTTDTSDLVKKTVYNTKINEIDQKITDHDHGKYVTPQEFSNFTADNFAARLAQGNLVSKYDIADLLIS